MSEERKPGLAGVPVQKPDGSDKRSKPGKSTMQHPGITPENTGRGKE